MDEAARDNRKRVSVVLSCPECGARNYKTTKAVKDGQKALILKKFCKHCAKHTEHREAR